MGNRKSKHVVDEDPKTLVVDLVDAEARSSDEEKTYTVYLIQVKYKGVEWTVERRFRELFVLNGALRKKYNRRVKFPKFPPRRLLGNLHDNVVKKRQQQLATYMKTLSQDKIIARSSDFRAFLEVDLRVKLSGAASGGSRGSMGSARSFSSMRSAASTGADLTPLPKGGEDDQDLIASEPEKEKDAEDEENTVEGLLRAGKKVEISAPYDVKRGGRARIVNKNIIWTSKDFVFEAKLGEGSYGVVYKAHLVNDPGFKLAIKVMEPTDIEDSVRNEYTTLQKCTHKNILAYVGICFDGPRLWIVTEYCHVGSVYEMMQALDIKLNEEQVAWVTREVLEGLQYLHKNKIIHRDIKAANVLIGRDCSIKIGDFGVSRLFKTDRQQTTTIMGTPHWMAPEVLEESYDFKADLWSLGITIYEMMTGRPPHSDIGMLKLYMKLSSEGPAQLPAEVNPSADLLDFMSKVLVINPAKRATAKDMLAHPFVKKAKRGSLSPLVEQMHALREEAIKNKKPEEILPFAKNAEKVWKAERAKKNRSRFRSPFKRSKSRDAKA